MFSLQTAISIPLLLGSLQGIFLAVSLPKYTKANRLALRALSALLLAGSISLLLYVFTIVFPVFQLRTIVFLDSLAFLFGPLTYLHFSKLLFPTKKVRIPMVLLLVPALLHFGYGLVIFGYPLQTMANKIKSGYFELQWASIFTVLIAWTLLFWFRSAYLLRRYYGNTKAIVSHKPHLKHLSVFLAALFLAMAISVIFALDFFFGLRVFNFTQTYLGWTIIPFVCYYLTYVSLGKPELLRTPYQIPKPFDSKGTSSELETIKVQLEHAMRTQKMYRDPTLSMHDLAIALGVGQTKLSYAINKGYQCNFYDFVNRFRLEDFVSKVAHDAHKKHTLLAIAFEVGFNSKTTFNKSFKRCFQLTPSQYINQMRS